MLRLEEVACGYPGTRGVVVDAVSLSLQPGAFVCVIGRNGAGKSTLMRTIAGLQPALRGRARLYDKDIATLGARDRARMIAVVTTERVSSPGLLARDVVELGRQPYTAWHGQLSDDDRAIVFEAMSKAGAVPFAPKSFGTLSDGERQRVMIARAFAQSADVMILDEITAFLDLPGRVEVMALLRRHAETTGKIVLLSSHDLDLSLELARELWIVHDGTLVHGTPSSLVASGAIGQAFDNEDVRFDPGNRRFRLPEGAAPVSSP